MVAPKTRKYLRWFIGLVNYYHDMWCHRSNLLAPIQSMMSKSELLALQFSSASRVLSSKTMDKSCNFAEASLYFTVNFLLSTPGIVWDTSPLEPSSFPTNSSCQLLDHKKFLQRGHTRDFQRSIHTYHRYQIPVGVVLMWVNKTQHHSVPN
jgi:hypothetical protein